MHIIYATLDILVWTRFSLGQPHGRQRLRKLQVPPQREPHVARSTLYIMNDIMNVESDTTATLHKRDPNWTSVLRPRLPLLY